MMMMGQGSKLAVLRRALDRLDKAMMASGGSFSWPMAPSSGADGGPMSPRRPGLSRGVSTGGGSGGGGGGGGRVSRCGGNWSPRAIADVAQRSSRLIFQMFYLTDELLYYALKHEGFVGNNALRLANLAYSMVFRPEVREA